MSLASVLRYWHTVRYLKASQVIGRVRFRLARPRVAPRHGSPPRRTARGAWTTGPARPASMTGPATFRFLNEERELSGWDDALIAKLWRYNLHYFDDLNAADAPARIDWHRSLMERWVEENPPGRGTGWEPYPTSLRIVNWVKWALTGRDLSARCAESLAMQAAWLARRLETHILGNHLFANAKALIFAGAFFEGDEPARWLDTGCDILAREIPEQILGDGGHFERSPMYHALAVEDVLDLINLARVHDAIRPAIIATCRDSAPRMLAWLDAMTHPDGDVSFFNDSAFGIAPAPAALAGYAERLGIATPSAPSRPVTHLEATGYVRAAAGPAVALLDVARVGPDYLPGHAHADTLSFECSLFGHRVLVNSGTSVYGEDRERQRQRGTAAHNTVLLEDQDSSEVWAGFRVARRARPCDLEILDAPPIRVRCSHDGYRRLPGRPTHRRAWTLDAEQLEVEDTILGGERMVQAVARLHLHPAVDATALDRYRVALRWANRSATLAFEGAASVEIQPSTWHPEFGRSVANRCVQAAFTGRSLITTLRWSEG